METTLFVASALMNILSETGYVSPEQWDHIVGPVLNAIAEKSKNKIYVHD